MNADLPPVMLRAISDPGSILERQPDESVSHWQARAAMEAAHRGDAVTAHPPAPVTVNVRWWDGYREAFEAAEVRAGCHLLWMRLADGGNRYVPLVSGVRWFSLSVEDHEEKR